MSTWRFSRFLPPRDLLAALLILLVAALFRGWQLGNIPPGLFGDEAVNGLDALDLLAGRPQLFYTANYGREGLAMALFAAGIRLFGPTALALRLSAAAAGVLTALATYWLGRELLARTRYRGTLAPLLAALFLATNFWHVYTSRYAERLIFTPLMATLAFAALWRGINRGGPRAAWRWFLLGGLFLGLSVHFYSISRLLPVFLALYVLAELGYRWLAGRVAPPQALLRRDFWPLVGLYGVALLVFAPLGWYFLSHPGSFTQRAGVVSAFNPQLNAGNPWQLIARAGWANLIQFFIPGTGDAEAFFNLPGRAVFDPLTALLTLGGMALCTGWVVAGLRRAAASEQGARLLFLWLWFPIMLIPALLAVDRFPALPRVMGVIPGVYFFPALTLAELARLGAARQRRGLVAGVIIAALLVHGGLTWRDYFQRWANSPVTFEAFEGDVAAATRWAAAHPDREIMLAADIYRHPTWLFLHEHAPLTTVFTYVNPAVHFFDGRMTLPLPAAGTTATYLFTANAGPDALLAAAPGWPGFATCDETTPGLMVCQLTGEGSARDQFQPTALSFAGGLTLQGYALRPLDDGRTALYFLWQVDGPHAGWYRGLQVQVGWQPLAGGGQLAQTSSELAYHPTEWATNGTALSWMTLPALPADAPAVTLAVRVVDIGTDAPLAATAADADGWMQLPLP